MIATPRDASSVILVRNTGEGDQVLLIRRHENLAFAGGTWVFPGGKLEPSDASAETLQKLGLVDAPCAATAGERAAREKIRGLVVAACRETFEETGILLARFAGGEFCDASLADSLQPFRADISRDPSLFPSLLIEHHLVIDPARLIRWSHWITPSSAPKRFDTRFFVALMPPGQRVQCDSFEATAFRWLDLPPVGGLPDPAIVPAPPTRLSLGDLALTLREHGSMDALMRFEAARVIAPIVPKVLLIDGRATALLPWDPDYPSAPGEGTPSDAQFPRQYLQLPARLVLP